MSGTYEYANPTYTSTPVSQSSVATTNNVMVANAVSAPVTPVRPVPQNYLVLNFITLFCCFPFGLIGLMYSSKVKSEWNSGNQKGAYDASRLAWNWGIAGITTGVTVFIVLMIVIISLSVVAAI